MRKQYRRHRRQAKEWIRQERSTGRSYVKRETPVAQSPPIVEPQPRERNLAMSSYKGPLRARLNKGPAARNHIMRIAQLAEPPWNWWQA